MPSSACENHIHEIQNDHLKNYLAYLYERPNRVFGGGLRKNYIRKHLQVIKKFSRYLTESGQESFEVKLRIKGKSSNIKSILTTAEITRLYDTVKDDVPGLRDKAMLALYYGCGLRKNEGINVNVQDILLEKDLVYVRKGKGYKERYVPLAGTGKTDLENYIHYARPFLVNGKKEDALLLNIHGKRFRAAYSQLQQLKGNSHDKKGGRAAYATP